MRALAYRELDDALGLSAKLHRHADPRTAKNGRHALVGMLAQPLFGRLARYEDVRRAVLSSDAVTTYLTRSPWPIGTAMGFPVVLPRCSRSCRKMP